MKLSLARADLVGALAAITRVIERRNTIPILSNLLLEATAGEAALTATDLDLTMRRSMPAQISEEAGRVTLPAGTLYDIARKLPEGAVVSIESEPDGHNAVLRAGRSRFTLPTLPAGDFPDMERGEMSHSFTVPAGSVERLIDGTAFAISSEETRYYLNGIFLHVVEGDEGPRLRGVATDGHRLARLDIAAPDGCAGMPAVIVPTKAVGEIKRIAEGAGEEVAIQLSRSKITVERGKARILSKLIDGTFPDYQRVIPVANNRPALLDGAALKAAIERVTAIASERGKAVKLTYHAGDLLLEMSDRDHGSAEETLPLAGAFDGPALTIGFNGRYVADILGTLGAGILEARMDDPGSPTLWQRQDDPSLVCVLMPMRV